MRLPSSSNPKIEEISARTKKGKKRKLEDRDIAALILR